MALYTPSRKHSVQKPFFGLAEVSEFLCTERYARPRIQSSFPVVSTTQEWEPELKPVEPRASALMRKRSGLLRICGAGLLYCRAVRSSEMDRQGWAVFGSTVTGTRSTKKTEAVHEIHL